MKRGAAPRGEAMAHRASVTSGRLAPAVLTTPLSEGALTQAQRVYQLLRGQIIACRLIPGERLNIARLAEQAGVSPGATREALSMLQSESLVTAEAQKGYTVSPVSRSDLADITRARVDLEELCLDSSMAVGDFAWEGEILAALHRLTRIEHAPADGGHAHREDWVQAHADFHAVLVSACDSRWLLRTRAILFEHSERYRRLAVPLAVQTRDTHAEHHALAHALIERDVARVHALIEDHVWTTARLVLDSPALSGR